MTTKKSSWIIALAVSLLSIVNQASAWGGGNSWNNYWANEYYWRHGQYRGGHYHGWGRDPYIGLGISAGINLAQTLIQGQVMQGIERERTRQVVAAYQPRTMILREAVVEQPLRAASPVGREPIPYGRVGSNYVTSPWSDYMVAKASVSGGLILFDPNVQRPFRVPTF